MRFLRETVSGFASLESSWGLACARRRGWRDPGSGWCGRGLCAGLWWGAGVGVRWRGLMQQAD
jgi:hypothetical protein